VDFSVAVLVVWLRVPFIAGLRFRFSGPVLVLPVRTGRDSFSSCFKVRF
jgi:hypothetical protein